MKKNMLTFVLSLVATLLQAQETMKVELRTGEIVKYNVDDIKRVYFNSVSDESTLAISPSSVSMYYDGSKQLSAPGATSWTTSNDFVAAVDDNGLVKGRHIGTTEITASNGTSSGICEVKIIPRYYLHDTPHLKWGDTPDVVQASETHNLEKETESGMLVYDYTFGSTQCYLIYTFTNNRLSSLMVMMPYSNSLLLQTSYYLMERYQPLGNSGYDYLFIDAMKMENARTVISHNMKTSGRQTIDVLYVDRSTLNSANSRKSTIENNEETIKIREMFLKKIEK